MINKELQARSLQRALLETNRLAVNTSKTNYMLFGTNQKFDESGFLIFFYILDKIDSEWVNNT